MQAVDRIDSQDRSEFSRANVLAHSDKVRLVDQDVESGLELYCYNRCDNEESPFVRQCRGLVFHNDTLVMKAFSYALEYNQTEKEELKNVLTNFDEWVFYRSYEGALLRMFWFGGKWFISTHRKLNAYRSKWSSKDSFGTMLEQALQKEVHVNPELKQFLSSEGTTVLEQFQNSLDKTKQYMFLLRNTIENRIVCQAPIDSPFMLHVGTFVDGHLSLSENIHIPCPERVHCSNLDELLQFVETLDVHELQGVIGINTKGEQVKILNSRYQELFRVRGNEPSVKFRYLQVRMDKKLTAQLYELYPDRTKEFDEYEDIIFKIAESILKSYTQRFIQKMIVKVSQEQFAVVRECHDWHLQDRFKNRISLNKVITVLNKQPARNLNSMIRQYRLSQNPKSDIPPRDYKGSRNNSPQINAIAPPVAVWKSLPPPSLQQK